MILSVQECTRTRLCASPCCPHDAQPGERLCAVCARPEPRAKPRRARAPRKPRPSHHKPRNGCKADDCSEPIVTAGGAYRYLCVTHRAQRRAELGTFPANDDNPSSLNPTSRVSVDA